MRLWVKVVLCLLALAILFYLPVTRQAILWILPLGSGVDDLVFFVALGVAAVVWLVNVFRNDALMERMRKWLHQEEDDDEKDL